MALKRKQLKQITCPVCDKKFQPTKKGQKYNSNLCAMKAYRHRVAEKLERLERLEQKAS